MSALYDFKNYRFMVIDDQPLVRQSLRSIIQTMGGFIVEMAQGYTDAINKIRATPPDVILCDYMMGSGRTGQQLLEEVRRNRLIPEEAIFLMVTGEQAYEQVVACVELIPDDYILKPFSPELLSLRLDRLMVKKQVMRPYFVAKREQRYVDAKRFLDQGQERKECRPYRVDFMRCNAELLLEQQRGTDAEQSYRDILEIYNFPWANVGIVKSLMQQRRFKEAQELIETVVTGSPGFFEAFDIKAEICAELGDHAEAQKTLAEVDAKNSKNYSRKRRLAASALANGDTETARKALADVLANDVVGDAASNLSDILALTRAHLEAGDEVEAELSLRKISSDQPMALDERLCFVGLVAAVTPARGKGPFLGMREAWLTTPMKEERLVDGLRGALALGEHELADQIARRLMGEEGVRRVFQSALAVYARYQRQQDFRNIQKAAALARISTETAGATKVVTPDAAPPEVAAEKSTMAAPDQVWVAPSSRQA
ncbi:MAG: response regulator [Rhodocyclaceae bacterium]|jgi:DNA-binding NarL/FixJ family response regulator|nr:response regulator [Rhodocyclaceae bacterium]